jgi:hypothetical protein
MGCDTASNCVHAFDSLAFLLGDHSLAFLLGDPICSRYKMILKSTGMNHLINPLPSGESCVDLPEVDVLLCFTASTRRLFCYSMSLQYRLPTYIVSLKALHWHHASTW